MTAEQYEKGASVFDKITILREWIISLEKPNSIRVNYPGKIDNPAFETSRYGFDSRVLNNITSYIHINETAMRAELIDFAKDEIAKLEDELKEI